MISTKSENNAKWEDEAMAQGLGFLREGGRETERPRARTNSLKIFWLCSCPRGPLVSGKAEIFTIEIDFQICLYFILKICLLN